LQEDVQVVGEVGGVEEGEGGCGVRGGEGWVVVFAVGIAADGVKAVEGVLAV